MLTRVPFNRPVYLNSHLDYLKETLSGDVVSAGERATALAEKWLSAQFSCPTIMTSSATHALEMMGLLLEIKKGDEVIIPSFTFVSTANAFVLRGATLRYADNDEFGNISIPHVSRLISKRTRAVVAVHYNGTSTDLSRLRVLCDAANVVLLEDAAQGIGAEFQNQPLGTLGSLSCLSFHDTKIVTSGEGGALIIGDSRFQERALIIRDKGTNRDSFLKRNTSFYTWIEAGSSYSMSELNAAYLYPQLLMLNTIIEKRKLLWMRYQNELETSLNAGGVSILKPPSYNKANYQHFILIFRNEALRNDFIEFMEGHQISTAFHFVPLHLSPYGKKWFDPNDQLLMAEWISSSIVRLPLYFNLTEVEQSRVISAVLGWLRLKWLAPTAFYDDASREIAEDYQFE